VSYDYLFGGLGVRATVPLLGLRPYRADAAAGRMVSLSVEEGPAPIPDRHHFSWPGRYGLTLGQVGERWLMTSLFGDAFLLDPDGRAIHAFCASLPPRQEFMDVLVRRILPRIATLFGATALHAAALGDGTGGLLFFGVSGAGKSTLTAALAQLAGWDILSDDISVVWTDEPPLLAPAATGVCVWPPSQAALELDPAQCEEMPGYGGKVRYDPGQRQSIDSMPLKGFVFLDRTGSDAPRLERVPLAQAIADAVQQIIKFNPDAPFPQERAVQVDRLRAMMRVIPSWRLVYPTDYAALPATIDTLRALLRA
jgi:hypothetical protein